MFVFYKSTSPVHDLRYASDSVVDLFNDADVNYDARADILSSSLDAVKYQVAINPSSFDTEFQKYLRWGLCHC